MAISFSSTSANRLKGLHPDLLRVIHRAAALATTAQDFMVLEGARSDEQCYINFGKGRTAAQCAAGGCPAKYANPGASKVTWLGHALSSNHRAKADGYGYAADLAPYPLDWNDIKRFDALAKLMFQAAGIEKVKIRWGADWDQDGKSHEKGETDSPHFELVR